MRLSYKISPPQSGGLIDIQGKFTHNCNMLTFAE